MRPIGDRLVIATHNPGKLREIAELVEPLRITCVGAIDLDLPEPEEIGNTFVDNADLKAREAADLSGLPALADDSGLCVDALHGAPGIFSARWAEDEQGNRDWMRAMERVWRDVEAAGPEAGHDAHFACALAIAWPNDGQVEVRSRHRLDAVGSEQSFDFPNLAGIVAGDDEPARLQLARSLGHRPLTAFS